MRRNSTLAMLAALTLGSMGVRMVASDSIEPDDDYHPPRQPRKPLFKAPEPMEYIHSEKPLTKRQKRRLRGKGLKL